VQAPGDVTRSADSSTGEPETCAHASALSCADKPPVLSRSAMRARAPRRGSEYRCKDEYFKLENGVRPGAQPRDRGGVQGRVFQAGERRAYDCIAERDMQQRLYLRPLPHGHGSLRPVLGWTGRGVGGDISRSKSSRFSGLSGSTPAITCHPRSRQSVKISSARSKVRTLTTAGRFSLPVLAMRVA
jgi:hypothetical protein